jgi:hypothetical protein
MSGAIPLLPLYAFMAWTGTPLPYTTLHRQVHCKHFPHNDRIFCIVFFPGFTQSWDSLFITPKQCFSCMGGYRIAEPHGCTRYSGNDEKNAKMNVTSSDWIDQHSLFLYLWGKWDLMQTNCNICKALNLYKTITKGTNVFLTKASCFKSCMTHTYRKFTLIFIHLQFLVL